MHMVMLLLGGAVLLAAVSLVAWRMGGWPAVGKAMPLFLAVWLCAMLVNFYIGVVHAGYSVALEAAVFVVVCGVPAAAAWLVRRTAAAKGG
jgi:hypothetical protein